MKHTHFISSLILVALVAVSAPFIVAAQSMNPIVNALFKTSQISSYGFTANAVVKSPEATITIQGASGAVDTKKDLYSVQVPFVFDGNKASVSIAGNSDKLFVRAQGIESMVPDLGSVDIKQFVNAWISIDMSDVEEFSKAQTFDLDSIEAMANTLKTVAKADFLKITKTKKTSQATTYSFALDKKKFVVFMRDMHRASTGGGEMGSLEIKTLESSLAEIASATGSAVVDNKTGCLSRMTMVVKGTDGSETTLTITLTGINKPQTVFIPQMAISLDDILAQFAGGAMATVKPTGVVSITR
jgi:VCBS repeat-containing protein